MPIDGRKPLILSNRRGVAAIIVAAALTNTLGIAVLFIAGTVGEGVIPIAYLIAAMSDSGALSIHAVRPATS